MSYRRQVALQTAVAVALVVLLLALLARQLTEAALIATVDDDLRVLANAAQQAAPAGPRPGRGPAGGPPGIAGFPELRALRRGAADGRFGEVTGVTQLLGADGRVLSSTATPALPVSPEARQVVDGAADEDLATLVVNGTRLRVLTRSLDVDLAVQLARPLTEADQTLTALTRRLTVAAAAGVVLAALLGWVLAGRVTGPVRELTELAESVSRTRDLSARLDLPGDDELARLADAFDRMLASLEQARGAQRQLIADASHELRTPLTSLRTNIDLLRSGVQLPAPDHDRLLADLGAQLQAFGGLVDGLVELARGEQPPASPEHLDLAELTAEVVAELRRDHPTASIHLQAHPCPVVGDRTRLARAVRNLVANALIHGGGEVEVEVGAGTVRVRDHGPGLEPALIPRLFDRFTRGADAGDRPGSGLGLAIVRQAAESHGGSVEAGNAPGGGAVFHLRLPPNDVD